MCSWFYWPLTLKYWTEGNEPEKIFMSKKVEQLSHSHMWNHHHRTMVIWRSKQSKEQHFLESIQMISKPGLILFEMMSHQFILQFRLKYAQKMPILCARTYEILSKQFKNESCVSECVLGRCLEQHDPTLSCQMRNECWDSQLFVEPVSSCTGDMSRGTAENRSNDSFMMNLCYSCTETFSKCQPNAAIYMRMALPHSWRRPGWPLSDNDDSSILHEDSNSRSTGQTEEL